MYRFEFSDDKSSKFWEIEQSDLDLHIRWGRLGSAGQRQTKTFADKTKASFAMFKLMREKTAKGYTELGMDSETTTTIKAREPAAPTSAAPAQPAPGSVAPWLEQGEPIRLDGSVHKICRPTRRHPHPIELVDPQRGWHFLRAALGAAITADVVTTIPALRDDVEAARRSIEDASPNGTPRTDAVLMALCVERDSRLEPATGVRLIDCLAARHGVAYVIDVQLTAMEYRIELVDGRLQINDRASPAARPWHAAPLSEAQWRLRTYLAGASQDIHDACAANVSRAIGALAPECQITLALLFPDLPDMTHATIDRLSAAGAGPMPDLRWLQFTATNDAALAQARTMDAGGYISMWQQADVNTILLEHRVDAVRWLAPYVLHDLPGDALTRIGTPESLAALAGAAGSARPALERFMRAVDLWPAAAMAALARYPGRDAREQALLMPILLSLVRRCPALPSRLQPWLDAPANALLETARARMDGPIDIATVDALSAALPALHARLAAGAMDRFPALPGFWQPTGWRRPCLHNGKALPDAALGALGTLMMSAADEDGMTGLHQVKAACTSQSMADFAWDCFSRWLGAGAPPRHKWALSNLGLFGLDDTARVLTPLIRAWPGEAAHARAIMGLDVLAAIGSDVALMLLGGIAQKVPFKGLQDKAREKIATIARKRGLRPEELEDRLAPDLGLDAQGTMLLDFGPRAFKVGFDEALGPYVREWLDGAPGRRLPDLPGPRKSDNVALADEAIARFKVLKKDARMVASQQVLRLERAMCARRRWSIAVFAGFIAGHPLVQHLARRLVWGVYAMAPKTPGVGRDARLRATHDRGALLGCFRVAEDGRYATADDEPYQLPEGEQIRIGLPHPLELPARVAADFGQLLSDYELVQPFPQLGRDTHALTDEERSAEALLRWQDIKVPTGKILGLAHSGWRRGPVEDGGMTWMYDKVAGDGRTIELTFEPGIIAGNVAALAEQTLGGITLGAAWDSNADHDSDLLSFGTLDPIAASELIRDMERLCA